MALEILCLSELFLEMVKLEIAEGRLGSIPCKGSQYLFGTVIASLPAHLFPPISQRLFELLSPIERDRKGSSTYLLPRAVRSCSVDHVRLPGYTRAENYVQLEYSIQTKRLLKEPNILAVCSALQYEYVSDCRPPGCSKRKARA